MQTGLFLEPRRIRPIYDAPASTCAPPPASCTWRRQLLGASSCSPPSPSPLSPLPPPPASRTRSRQLLGPVHAAPLRQCDQQCVRKPLHRGRGGVWGERRATFLSDSCCMLQYQRGNPADRRRDCPGSADKLRKEKRGKINDSMTCNSVCAYLSMRQRGGEGWQGVNTPPSPDLLLPPLHSITFQYGPPSLPHTLALRCQLNCAAFSR